MGNIPYTIYPIQHRVIPRYMGPQNPVGRKKPSDSHPLN